MQVSLSQKYGVSWKCNITVKNSAYDLACEYILYCSLSPSFGLDA